jgi:hypothetical protein
MADQMHLVLTQAALVTVDDHVWHRDNVYRVYAIESDPLHRRVRLCLESSRWGDLDVPLTALVPVEEMS